MKKKIQNTSMMMMISFNRDHNSLKTSQGAENGVNVSKSAVFLKFLNKIPV